MAKEQDVPETEEMGHQEAKETDTPQVVFAYASDWMGMYVNGKLVFENHSICPDEALEALGIPVTKFSCNEEWLENVGNLPKEAKDLEGFVGSQPEL